MAKTFRFLVTIPVSSCPTPHKADMVEELKLNLSRYYHGVQVRGLLHKEHILKLSFAPQEALRRGRK